MSLCLFAVDCSMNCRAHDCWLCLTSMLHSLLYFFLAKWFISRYLSLLSRHIAMKWESWSLCFASLHLRLAISKSVLRLSYSSSDNLCDARRQLLCALYNSLLNFSMLVVVIAASSLFHNFVLIVTSSESCLSALVTVFKLLKLMTQLIVMFASMRARLNLRVFNKYEWVQSRCKLSFSSQVKNGKDLKSFYLNFSWIFDFTSLLLSSSFRAM